MVALVTRASRRRDCRVRWPRRHDRPPSRAIAASFREPASRVWRRQRRATAARRQTRRRPQILVLAGSPFPARRSASVSMSGPHRAHARGPPTLCAETAVKSRRSGSCRRPARSREQQASRPADRLGILYLLDDPVLVFTCWIETSRVPRPARLETTDRSPAVVDPELTAVGPMPPPLLVLGRSERRPGSSPARGDCIASLARSMMTS